MNDQKVQQLIDSDALFKHIDAPNSVEYGALLILHQLRTLKHMRCIVISPKQGVFFTVLKKLIFESDLLNEFIFETSRMRHKQTNAWIFEYQPYQINRVKSTDDISHLVFNDCLELLKDKEINVTMKSIRSTRFQELGQKPQILFINKDTEFLRQLKKERGNFLSIKGIDKDYIKRLLIGNHTDHAIEYLLEFFPKNGDIKLVAKNKNKTRVNLWILGFIESL